MIFALIVTILLCLICLIFTILAIKDGEVGASLFLIFMTSLSGLLVGVIIDAMCKNNEQMVEYRFSAEHYAFQEEISVSRKTIYLNGVETVEEQRDTTYVLTGIEPIVVNDNNYDRKVLKDK